MDRYNATQAASAAALALLLALSPADTERALRIGNGTEAERATFHAPYIAAAVAPDVERLEVVTAFRRVVLAQEEHLRRGDHMFSAKQARAEVGSLQGKITIVVQLRFHPLNVLARVPDYEVALDEPPAAAAAVRRTPLYANLGAAKKPRAATPLIGGLVEADFDAAAIGQRRRTVRVVLDGKEVGRATFDFARLE